MHEKRPIAAENGFFPLPFDPVGRKNAAHIVYVKCSGAQTKF